MSSQSCARSRPPNAAAAAAKVRNVSRSPFGPSLAEGLSTVETAQMTRSRSQQTSEEIAVADRVDGLPDDFSRQSRSNRPDVRRLIDESGGRNADALDLLDSSRMLHGEVLWDYGSHDWIFLVFASDRTRQSAPPTLRAVRE